MANIFRSKDVFKRAPGIPSSEDPSRKVSGVYVVGDYKPPYYINSGITISGINNTKATVVDYTEKSVNASDCSTVGILSVDVTSSTVDVYTRQYRDASDCSTVGILSIDVTESDILQYQRSYVNASDCSTVGILSIDVTDSEIVRYSTNRQRLTPEPMLRIKSITTSKAIIANI